MNKNVYYNFFDFFKKTIFYKISLIVVYIVAIFGILSSPGDANVFKTLYFNFANPYLIEALIILSIINIIFLNKTFFQSYPSFIRSTNRKQYFDDLLKKIFVTNNNIFNNYFLISLLLSILKNFGKISMEIYTFYNIPLIFYDSFNINFYFFYNKIF